MVRDRFWMAGWPALALMLAAPGWQPTETPWVQTEFGRLRKSTLRIVFGSKQVFAGRVVDFESERATMTINKRWTTHRRVIRIELEVEAWTTGGAESHQSVYVFGPRDTGHINSDGWPTTTLGRRYAVGWTRTPNTSMGWMLPSTFVFDPDLIRPTRAEFDAAAGLLLAHSVRPTSEFVDTGFVPFSPVATPWFETPVVDRSPAGAMSWEELTTAMMSRLALEAERLPPAPPRWRRMGLEPPVCEPETNEDAG